MLISFSSNKFQRDLSGGTGREGGGGILLEILGGGVPHSSPNHDLISDQKFYILTPLHNINRQSVKANKFIWGRLGENQP